MLPSPPPLVANVPGGMESTENGIDKTGNSMARVRISLTRRVNVLLLLLSLLALSILLSSLTPGQAGVMSVSDEKCADRNTARCCP